MESLLNTLNTRTTLFFLEMGCILSINKNKYRPQCMQLDKHKIQLVCDSVHSALLCSAKFKSNTAISLSATYKFFRLATFGATFSMYSCRLANDKGLMCFTSLWQSNWQCVQTPCSISKRPWKFYICYLKQIWLRTMRRKEVRNIERAPMFFSWKYDTWAKQKGIGDNNRFKFNSFSNLTDGLVASS